MVVLSCYALTTALFFSACTKNRTIALPLTVVEIKVRSGNSWSLSNAAMTIVSGATINLYETPVAIIHHQSPTYSATTNYLGVAAIPVDYKKRYYFTVEKGKAKNTLDGLLITGIFGSQAAIDTSPVQLPAPAVGSPSFLDTNGDGIINSPDDNVYADYIDIIQNNKVTKTAIIYQ